MIAFAVVIYCLIGLGVMSHIEERAARRYVKPINGVLAGLFVGIVWPILVGRYLAEHSPKAEAVVHSIPSPLKYP